MGMCYELLGAQTDGRQTAFLLDESTIKFLWLMSISYVHGVHLLLIDQDLA